MQPLLLLHGALGAASQFEALKDLLKNSFELHTIDFSGHGISSQNPDQFGIELFAQDVVSYLDKQGLKEVTVFGYSMGGYVGLYLARHFPARIKSIVTLATKMHWDEVTAARETGMLNVEKIIAKVPQLAIALSERHADKEWTGVVNKTAGMLLKMGADSPLKEDDFKHLDLPVMIMLGDRDKMVGLDETVNVYKKLPNAKMAVLPDTPHPFEQVNLDALAFFIRQML
jgi:pimeloyl-ACP methyl ester carboxylesterase